MSAIINGSSPSVTFSDGTTQATSAIVSGYVPYANLPAGSVLQVVNATYTSLSTSSSSTYADTGLSASITPKFSTSKILVIVDHNGCRKDTNNTSLQVALFRGATQISGVDGSAGNNNTTAVNDIGNIGISYLDSPATTSSTTYKTQFKSQANSANVYVNDVNGGGATASTMTLMEIAQ